MPSDILATEKGTLNGRAEKVEIQHNEDNDALDFYLRWGVEPELANEIIRVRRVLRAIPASNRSKAIIESDRGDEDISVLSDAETDRSSTSDSDSFVLVAETTFDNSDNDSDSKNLSDDTNTYLPDTYLQGLMGTNTRAAIALSNGLQNSPL